MILKMYNKICQVKCIVYFGATCRPTCKNNKFTQHLPDKTDFIHNNDYGAFELFVDLLYRII